LSIFGECRAIAPRTDVVERINRDCASGICDTPQPGGQWLHFSIHFPSCDLPNNGEAGSAETSFYEV
jgi:hypothetical protein